VCKKKVNEKKWPTEKAERADKSGLPAAQNLFLIRRYPLFPSFPWAMPLKVGVRCV